MRTKHVGESRATPSAQPSRHHPCRHSPHARTRTRTHPLARARAKDTAISHTGHISARRCATQRADSPTRLPPRPSAHAASTHASASAGRMVTAACLRHSRFGRAADWSARWLVGGRGQQVAHACVAGVQAAFAATKRNARRGDRSSGGGDTGPTGLEAETDRLHCHCRSGS